MSEKYVNAYGDHRSMKLRGGHGHYYRAGDFYVIEQAFLIKMGLSRCLQIGIWATKRIIDFRTINSQNYPLYRM